ncbi:uncharacterized protein [Triticum aestivum]|uniref:uncharacterized protein n=1 Tax=Triticum aestivum TaxID=4565 RepID=UPI001D0207F0|nr:uncharacterized protein LOC123120247 [Triticum aestivum]
MGSAATIVLPISVPWKGKRDDKLKESEAYANFSFLLPIPLPPTPPNFRFADLISRLLISACRRGSCCGGATRDDLPRPGLRRGAPGAEAGARAALHRAAAGPHRREHHRGHSGRNWSDPRISRLTDQCQTTSFRSQMLYNQHLRLFLKIGATLETGKGCSLVADMSARVGSIDIGLEGWHSYRASKTAPNQLTKTASVELGKRDNIACILLHPGTVDTDLSRPFQ